MLAKQFISTGLRAVKASAPTAARQSARLTIPSGLSCLKTTTIPSVATSIRSISSTPLKFEEQPSQSDPPSSQNQSSAYAAVDLPAVYLSNLSFSVTEEALTEFISQYSPVKKVDVVRNSDGAIRGFGFAKYATVAEAEAAVAAINGLEFLGRQLVAAISQRRPVISDASNQLFMSGFPTQGEADEASLREALHERLGIQPRAIRLHKFPGGFLKGTGHIEFNDAATLESVLAKLQEQGPDQPVIVNGHPLTLVKARPLLQSRTRAAGGRGAFDSMRGRGPQAYGAAPYGAYGAYPPGPPGGYPPMGGYAAPVGGPGYPTQSPDNAYYPPPIAGSGGYGGGYGSHGQGGQGGGNPPY